MSAAEDVEVRFVLPRSALGTAARAEFFSQENSLELLGLPRRAFLELLRRADAPPVVRVGKLRLVEREPMLAFLRASRVRDVRPSVELDKLDGPDRVLAEIGCVPANARRVG